MDLKKSELSAYEIVLSWAEGRNATPFPQEAWDACERADWMLWAMAKANMCDMREIILTKAKVANQVRHLMRDERSVRAVDAALSFAEGEIGEEDLKAAYAAANDADKAAAKAAVYPSPYAADAYAAAATAALAAAYAGATHAAEAAYAAALHAADAEAYTAAAIAAATADATTTSVYAAHKERKAGMLKKAASICREVLPSPRTE